jgi:ribosomal protein L16/L10AE
VGIFKKGEVRVSFGKKGNWKILSLKVETSTNLLKLRGRRRGKGLKRV